jgi:hypothetical protein
MMSASRTAASPESTATTSTLSLAFHSSFSQILSGVPPIGSITVGYR